MRNKKLLALAGSVVLALVLVALPFMTACAKPEPTPAEPTPAAPAAPTSKPYPSKTITWVVGYAAGGSIDARCRIMSTGFIDYFGVYCHMVNVDGASGTVGWKYMLDQPADGYHMILNSATPMTLLLREEKPPFSAYDAKPVCLLDGKGGIQALLTKPDAPWATWEKFKAYVTANPGKLTVGGTATNRQALWGLTGQAGLRDKLAWVPYDSAATANTDMLGGHLDAAIASVANLVPLWPSKAVAIVCTGGENRGMKELEGVPNAVDLGYEPFYSSQMLCVHPDTPDEIADIIAAKFEKLCQDESLKKAMNNIGILLEFVPRSFAKEHWPRMIKQVEELIKTGFM